MCESLYIHWLLGKGKALAIERDSLEALLSANSVNCITIGTPVNKSPSSLLSWRQELSVDHAWVHWQASCLWRESNIVYWLLLVDVEEKWALFYWARLSFALWEFNFIYNYNFVRKLSSRLQTGMILRFINVDYCRLITLKIISFNACDDNQIIKSFNFQYNLLTKFNALH